ncbi:hypothetical protein [Nonomuraea jiangxiensis]|uniref:Uncharacterized protein n=1 Tax=Nonomuraea jiangxiensis TaxID=633440 RepID=A0A1G9GXI2_9ACTN|nr:hypothetical protein [Nonomuraea jiangxiensis]SDL05294.1 hypothetical protein SAMN05421869_121172 [Nonomuraea jiangxiensis]
MSELPEGTGDEGVDAIVAGLGRLGELPVAEHVAVFDEAFSGLEAALEQTPLENATPGHPTPGHPKPGPAMPGPPRPGPPVPGRTPEGPGQPPAQAVGRP